MMRQKKQQGFLYIVAIVLITVISLILSAAVYQTTINAKAVTNSLQSAQAYYMAQSGINYAQHQFYYYAAYCGQTFTEVGFPGSPGVFTVTSSQSGSTCTVTSTGYIPNATSPVAKRTLQATLVSYGVAASPIMTLQTVTMNNQSNIINLNVTSTSPDYPGSTVDAGGTVTLNGNVFTAVSGLSPSSTTSIRRADIRQNNTGLTAATLFSSFFSVTPAQIISGATLVSTADQLNNVGGGTFYSSVPLTFTQQSTIGTSASPAIVLVNGNVAINNNTTMYGVLYVLNGTLSISNNTSVYGAVAAEQGITLNGNTTIILNTSVLNSLHQINNSTTLHYNDAFGGLQEIIP